MSNPEVPGRDESGEPLARSPIGTHTQRPGSDAPRERADHVRPAGRPRVPHPREALVHEAQRGDEHALFWNAVYYAALTAIVQGRKRDVPDAMTAIVTGQAKT